MSGLLPALLSLLLCSILYGATCSSSPCPCTTPELCQPVSGQRDFEVFVFDVGGKTWKSYNWSLVTTVATFGKYDAELMCHAHSQGARVVLKGDVPLSYIVDQDNRTAWIMDKVELAKSQFMDGINIDIEQAVEDGSLEKLALTALVKETTEIFHKEIPGSQVSFDVAWSPKCIDKRCYDYVTIAESCDLLFVMSYDEQSQIMGDCIAMVSFDVAWSPKCIDKRCYDYVTIAESCDLLFVMSYDEQSQIMGDCIAMANAPVLQTLDAYDQYLGLKIDPKKLIMGVPWYGYDYPCINFSKEGICSIEKVPFRGAPCSDAAGKQKTYKWLMETVNSSMSNRQWDDKQKAPYFNYISESGQIHQVWYDDPQSICLKANSVKAKGLRGIGMWNGNILAYSDEPVAKQQTTMMWNALLGC